MAIKEWFIRKDIFGWKLIAFGAVCLLVLISIIFAFPLKNAPYQVTEIYRTTEMKQESYTDTEPYIVRELTEKTKVLFDEYRLTVPIGIDIPFAIDKPDAQLMVSFECSVPGGFYVFTVASHIIYEQRGSSGSFELSLEEGDYKARFSENMMWGEQVHIQLAMQWTEMEEVIKYKEVTKYRDVPVEVEKQRDITEYKNISMWKWLFSGLP